MGFFEPVTGRRMEEAIREGKLIDGALNWYNGMLKYEMPDLAILTKR